MTDAGEQDHDWDFHLTYLSSRVRDSTVSVSDPDILQSVTELHKICKAARSEGVIARVYTQLSKLFHRVVTSLSQPQTSNGLLLLALLQFFLDFGDNVLHDVEPSLLAFFRSCLSREFSDPIIAEATLNFINLNKTKLLISASTLLPQFFPLLLKLVAWNGEKLEKSFMEVFPALISPASFLPLFPSLLDLPILVVILENVERKSGPFLGSAIASIQKSKAPEMLLALMDEAYTGSAIEDGGVYSGSDDGISIDVADSQFLDLLKDENDGLPECQWTSFVLVSASHFAAITSRSERLKQALDMTPRFLNLYFTLALQDVNDYKHFSYEGATSWWLPPYQRPETCLVHKPHSHAWELNPRSNVRKKLLEFMLAAFQRSPCFIALLKKPITDRLGQAYENPAKTELAAQLCWAIGEHGGGGVSHKDTARELFESLELLLYENLSSRFVGIRNSRKHGSLVLCLYVILNYIELTVICLIFYLPYKLLHVVEMHLYFGHLSSFLACNIIYHLYFLLVSHIAFDQKSSQKSDITEFRKSNQARLLCFVVTAIAKLATAHAELLPRARVSLAKVVRSQNSDPRVQTCAHDYLGLMNEPAICLSVLGSESGSQQDPGTIKWSEGGLKMIAHFPFYLLCEQEGPPFHNFSIVDVIPGRH